MKMLNAKEDLGLTLEEIASIQEYVWNLISSGQEMPEVVSILESLIIENPRILTAVLANYYMFSQFVLKTSPEELDKIWNK